MGLKIKTIKTKRIRFDPRTRGFIEIEGENMSIEKARWLFGGEKEDPPRHLLGVLPRKR